MVLSPLITQYAILKKMSEPKIENSADYFKTKEMHLFGKVEIAYRYLIDKVIKPFNPEFEKQSPDQLCILGGFFPARENIEGFQKLAQFIQFPTDQLRYFDFNDEPATILKPEEKNLFRKIDLKNIATAEQNGEVMVPPNSVKMIVLDHVTEFMDDTALTEFLTGLSEVLADDGVALMAVVKLRAKFWHKFKARIGMGVSSFPRTLREWQEAVQPHLKISYRANYSIGERTATLFMLSKKSSPYPEETIDDDFGQDELVMYDIETKKQAEQPKRAA